MFKWAKNFLALKLQENSENRDTIFMRNFGKKLVFETHAFGIDNRGDEESRMVLLRLLKKKPVKIAI